MTKRTGKCLCGAVRYEIEPVKDEAGACHCKSCQAWSGGVYMAIHVAAGNIAIEGEDKLAVYTSSDWAERAFCSKCGSSMFYRMTMPGPMQGDCHVAAGTLDDWSGLGFEGEIFIDRKPDAYALAGDAPRMTAEQFFAQYGGGT